VLTGKNSIHVRLSMYYKRLCTTFFAFHVIVRLRPKITIASFEFSLDAVVFWIIVVWADADDS